MTKQTLTLAALALSALGAAPALAQDAPVPAPAPEQAGPPPVAPQWFGGRMTEGERSALMQERFAAADANGDGQISSDEMVAAVEAAIEARRLERIQRLFEAIDADGSGALSLEELEQAGPGPMFGEGRQRGRGWYRDGHGHGRPGGERGHPMPRDNR